MDEDDQEWIQDNQGDIVNETDAGFAGTFTGTIFLSTDGKHTVSITASTHAGRRDGMKWAKQVYERLMIIYGSKQMNAAKEYKKIEKEDAGLGRCPKCNSPMALSSKINPKTGKQNIYCIDKCWLK